MYWRLPPKPRALRWEAVDRRGERLSGVCRGESVAALEESLAGRGLALIRARRAAPRPWPVAPGGRWSRPVIAEALRHLADLTEAGVAIHRALGLTAREVRDRRLRAALRACRIAVERGEGLSERLGRDALRLDRARVALIAAGERSGALEHALRQVAGELERAHHSAAAARRAMAYPASVAVAAVGVMLVLVFAVIPRFEAIYLQSGQTLPGPTRVLLAVSEHLATTAPLAAALMGCGVLAGRWALQQDRPRRAVQRLLWRTPLLGTFWRDAALARFCRSFGELLAAGVPFLEALPHAADAGHHPVLRQRVARIEHAVAGGTPVSRALRILGVDAEIAVRLTAVGAESGQLDGMLLHAGHRYQQRLERRLERCSAVLGPTLILIAAALTAAVVVALYLPLFQLGGAVHAL